MFQGIVLAAYGMAMIPLFIYITSGWTVFLMGCVIGLASLAVSIVSIQRMLALLGREKVKTPVPRRFENSKVLTDWWICFREARRWQLLMVLPRLGMAYGLMQWFHTQFPWSHRLHFFFHPYEYTSYGAGTWDARFIVYPQIETIVFGMLFVLLFALAEAGLFSILTIQNHNQFDLQRFAIVNVLTQRIVIIVLASVLSPVISQMSVNIYNSLDDTPFDQETTFGFYHFYLVRAFGETLHTAGFNLSDNGQLLAANMMRNPRGITMRRWDSRLFVLRQIVAGIGGLLLYGGIIGFNLWLASHRREYVDST